MTYSLPSDSRLGRHVSAGLVATVLLALSATIPGTSFALDIEEVEVVKTFDRIAGTPVPSTPYFFGACAIGADIQGVTLKRPSLTVDTLILEEPGEYCIEVGYSSQAALGAVYGNGDYVFTITGTGGSPVDTKTVTFNATPALAFADMIFPVQGGTVSTIGASNFMWNLEQISSCAGATCGDWILIDADDHMGGEIFRKLPITDTSVLIPETDFSSNRSYELEAIVFRGFFDNSTTDSSDAIFLINGWADINGQTFITDGQLDVESVDMVKAHLRIDGTPITDPYSFDVCTSGQMISAVSLSYPGGSDIILTPDGNEFCHEAVFATLNDLDAAFPDGTYTLNYTGTDAKIDFASFDFQQFEPQSWTPIISPMDGATVTPNTPLDVTWSLTELNDCINNATCGDNVFLSSDSENAEGSLELFSINATQGTIPGTSVPDNDFLYIEVGTLNGGLGTQLTDQRGEVFDFAIGFISANEIRVPEPSLLVAQLAALGTIVWLRRRGRGH